MEWCQDRLQRSSPKSLLTLSLSIVSFFAPVLRQRSGVNIQVSIQSRSYHLILIYSRLEESMFRTGISADWDKEKKASYCF